MRRGAFLYPETAWLDTRTYAGIFKIYRTLRTRSRGLPAKNRLGCFYRGGICYVRDLRSPEKLGRFPAVGDFVVLLHQPEAGCSTIVDILPRKSVFTRGTSAKEGTDQVIAANIDIVFIVTAAGHDLNARRIERYLAIAHASGAKPVIVINKSDLTDDPALLTDEIIPVASGIPVIPISAISGDGITRLEPFLTPGTTIVLIGSSGVGKSTLINRLLDRPIQETSVIRDYDGKGRHTTTVPAALHYEERGTHDR